MIVGIHDVVGRDVKGRLAKREGAIGSILGARDNIIVLRKRELEVTLGKLGALEHLGARDLCMGSGYAVRSLEGNGRLIGASLDSLDMPRSVIRPVRAPASTLGVIEPTVNRMIAIVEHPIVTDIAKFGNASAVDIIACILGVIVVNNNRRIELHGTHVIDTAAHVGANAVLVAGAGAIIGNGCRANGQVADTLLSVNTRACIFYDGDVCALLNRALYPISLKDNAAVGPCRESLCTVALNVNRA